MQNFAARQFSLFYSRLYIKDRRKSPLSLNFCLMSVNSISLWQGPINKTREEYVRKAFQKMDATGDGQITVDDIRKLYDASQHPKFQSGEWTADQCFRHFLDSFDTPGDPDGVVYNLSDVKNLNFQ